MEEHNLESPRVITIENTTNEPIVFQWRLTGNKETVAPGDTIKFTVTTSEELSFFEDQFAELNIEYESDEPEPPTPTELKTKTYKVMAGDKLIISSQVLGNALDSGVSQELQEKVAAQATSGIQEVCVHLGTINNRIFGLAYNYELNFVKMFITPDTPVSKDIGGSLMDNATIHSVIWALVDAGGRQLVCTMPDFITQETDLKLYTNGVKIEAYTEGTSGTIETTTQFLTIPNNTYAIERPESYTITWKNYDNTVLETDTVIEGTVPTYSGETPTKPSDEEYDYTFLKWTPDVVAATEDAVYTATYKATPKPGPIPFETTRVTGITTHSDIYVDSSALQQALTTALEETEYWTECLPKTPIDVNVIGIEIGRTSDGRGFGFICHEGTETEGLYLGTPDIDPTVFPPVSGGSTDSQVSEIVGTLYGMSIPVTTNILGDYLDLYTNGFVLRIADDQGYGQVTEYNIYATMPQNYVTLSELEIQRVSTTNNVTVAVNDWISAVQTGYSGGEYYESVLFTSTVYDPLVAVEMGTTADGRHFGLILTGQDETPEEIYLYTDGGDLTAVPQLYEGCVNAVFNILLGYMEAPDHVIIPGSALGSFLSYYTNGFKIRASSSDYWEIHTCSVQLPQNYITATSANEE